LPPLRPGLLAYAPQFQETTGLSLTANPAIQDFFRLPPVRESAGDTEDSPATSPAVTEASPSEQPAGPSRSLAAVMNDTPASGTHAAPETNVVPAPAQTDNVPPAPEANDAAAVPQPIVDAPPAETAGPAPQTETVEKLPDAQPYAVFSRLNTERYVPGAPAPIQEMRQRIAVHQIPVFLGNRPARVPWKVPRH
jgi:hypothetical protein